MPINFPCRETPFGSSRSQKGSLIIAQSANHFDPAFSDARRLLSALFAEGGETEFRVIGPSGRVKAHFGPLDDAMAQTLLTANREGGDIYFVPNHTRRRAGYTSDQDIVGITAIFIDIDREEAVEGENVRRLKVAPLAPSFIIQTSDPHRLQAYWCVDRIEVAESRLITLQMIEKFGADRACTNPAHLMRLPSFFHLKGEPKPCRTIYDSGARYAREDFIGAFGLSVEAPKRRDGGDFSSFMPTAEDEAWLVNAARKWAAEVRGRGQGRHDVMKRVAVGCARNRIPFERAEIIGATFVKDLPPRSARDDDFEAEFQSLLAWAYEHQDALGPPWRLSLGGEEVPHESQPLHQFKRTDYGNAERLARRHGHDIRHVGGLGWLVWDGRRWCPDGSGEIMRRAKETVRAGYDELSSIASDDERAAFARHLSASEAEPRLKAMISLASSERRVAAVVGDFDTHPMLLNCANGTVDLRTGELRGHRRDDLITQIAPVAYDPDAICPTWDAFQHQICNGDAELVAFKQRALGYTLTGHTSEHLVFIAYGTGANGKSTELEVIRALMGDYAKTAEFSTFEVKRGDGPRNDLARLRGTRFVVSSESDQGSALSESVVKSLTGGDTIAARFLHKEHFEFAPTFALWLATNHKPTIRGTDLGIWRRICLVPYEVTIAEEVQDKNLRTKLLAELPGILAWVVRGCLMWQQDGLAIPAKIRDVTRAYRTEMDSLGDFLESSCEEGAAKEVDGKVLRQAYVRYCEEMSERPMTPKALTQALNERGFALSRRGRNGRFWRGLELRRDVPRRGAFEPYVSHAEGEGWN